MMHKIVLLAGIASLSAGCGPSQQKANVKQNPPVTSPAASQPVSVDGRIVVNLSDLQRDHVLSQMRIMLDSTQQIVEGLAEEDMELVEEAARISGFKLSQTPEHRVEMKGLQMNKSLPQEFRQMSRTTRMMFDEVADMAARGESANDIQKVFAEGLYSCNACHSTYQIPSP